MNDIIKIIKSLKDLGVLIDRVTEIVKHEKKKEDRFFGTFLAPVAASLVQPVISSVVKAEEELEEQEEDIYMKSFSSDPLFKQ